MNNVDSPCCFAIIVYMNRMQKLESLKTHAWLKRLFKKLNASDEAFMRSVILGNEHLDRGQFELMLNRLFIDVPNKPKNWKYILEALANANCI